MKVQVISREIIKPSSSTPQHLGIYKLSLHDQLAPRSLLPYKKSHHLKQSFSEALTHLYPLAGRITDDLFCIDCNDDGGSYSEARVAGDMSTILQDPNRDQLEMLLPCHPCDVSPEISSQVILVA
ncbi:hypothetical protein RCOM_1470030 [Ricinus communis]|uniref:Transferase n=1 Tax=Ricinus communis TaxID=3988 RepID=B9RLQ6_RICCO|nr:hypothetical protein RCOM_1470030 [Ricinus communis]